MFCSKCGARVPDGDAFCGNCGAPAPVRRASTTAGAGPVAGVAPTETMPPVSSNLAAGGEAGAVAAQPPKRNRTTLVAVLIAVAAACVVLGLFGLHLWHERQAKESATYPVSFEVTAPGYDAGQDSRIPLHVTGTRTNGETVDQDFYVSETGDGVELGEGSYTVVVVASPLLHDGSLYAVPAEAWNVSVSEEGAVVGSGEEQDRAITFEVLDPLEVTDEEIEAAVKAASADLEFDQALVETYRQAVVKSRDDAQAAKQAEEEAAAQAQKEAEEEAARQAAEEEERRAQEEAASEEATSTDETYADGYYYINHGAYDSTSGETTPLVSIDGDVLTVYRPMEYSTTGYLDFDVDSDKKPIEGSQHSFKIADDCQFIGHDDDGEGNVESFEYYPPDDDGFSLFHDLKVQDGKVVLVEFAP